MRIRWRRSPAKTPDREFPGIPAVSGLPNSRPRSHSYPSGLPDLMSYATRDNGVGTLARVALAASSQAYEIHAYTERIAVALIAYAESSGSTPDECDEILVSLLADLRHICNVLHLDFDRLSERAARHFEAEDTNE